MLDHGKEAQGIRKHGNVLCNTTHWETSLMKSVIAEHICTLGEKSRLFREGTCLQNAKGAPQRRWRHSYAMLAWFLWECLACRALVVNFFLGQQLLLVMLSVCTMWMEAHQLSMQLKSIAFWKSHVVMWPLSKNICSRKFQTNKMFPNGQWRCPEIRVLLLYKKSRVLSLTMLPKAGWHASPLHSCNFEGTCNFHPQQMSLENKLRWYAQQPQRFIFTNLSEACCKAKRWKHFSWVSVS